MLIFCVVTAIVSAIGGVVVFQTTSRSNFCNKCHLMEPYYESWQRSKHAGVECTQCHMPPDLKGKMMTKFQALTQLTKYVTRTYGTRPWGHVTDESCLTCHDLGKLQKQGARPFGDGLKFAHGPHLADQVRNKKLRCTTCHTQVERSTHMQVAVQACYTCHFKADAAGQPTAQAKCTSCHDATAKPDSRFAKAHAKLAAKPPTPETDCTSCHRAVIHGEGDAPAYRCMQCHNDRNVTKLIERPDELHRVHVTEKGAQCFNCHTEITHRRPAEPRSDKTFECRQCHDDAHGPQMKLFGGQLVPDGTPSGMYAAGLQCSSCHVAQVTGAKRTLDLKPEACGSCHSASLAARALIWQEAVVKMADDLAQQLATAKPMVAQTLVELKKARPVHNLPHARQVLDRAHAELKGAPPLPYQKWDQKERCLRCHFASVGADTPYRGKPFGNEAKPFSHEVHRAEIKNVQCATCHEESGQPHGKLKDTKHCQQCHEPE